MKTNRATTILGLLFVIASFALAAALYSRLPDPVPTHWNLRGEADGFTPKPWGAFVLPLVTAGCWLLFLVLPRLSPRGYRLDRFARVYGIIQVVITGFMFALTCLALLAAIGVPVAMDRVLYAGLGALFIVLGNYLGKVTRNFFVGIRTPWTLASDEVWLRTHRLGSRCFVAGGIVALVGGLAGGGAPLLVTAVGIAALVPVVYSYVIYRRLEGDDKDGGAAPESR